MDEIEERLQAEGHQLRPVDEKKAIDIIPQKWIPYPELARTFLRRYPRRTALGFSLMATQAFLYNAIFFSYALVLQHFFRVSKAHTSYYFLPFAIGNLLGPLLLGPLFDTVGRRKMISGTYLMSGVLLAVSACAVRRRPPERDHPDRLLVRDLLLRLGRARPRPT